jgi:hypothetical protein
MCFRYFASLEIKHVRELKAVISNTYSNMHYGLLYYTVIKYKQKYEIFKIDVLIFNFLFSVF